jgi:hypothetical protein
MSDGRRGYEPDLPTLLGDELQRQANRLPRLLGITQLGLSEALERQVVRGEQRLAGLLGGLLSLTSAGKCTSEIAEHALDLAEEKQQVRPRAFVAQFSRASKQLDQHVATSFVRICPHPVLADTDERLIQDATPESGRLKSQRLVGGRGRGPSAEKGLGPEFRDEHVGGKRLVADFAGEAE